MKRNNIIKTLLVSFITLILLSIFSYTYAFFSLQIEGTGKDIVMSTGDLRLEYKDEIELKFENAVPGDIISKVITVKNIGTKNVSYSLYWENLINTIDNYELHVTLDCKSYTNYGEKTKLKNENIKSIIPSYQMDNNRRYMTDNEIKDLANKMNKTLSKYTNKKSKWSKNISIVNNENAGKLWSCDIRISNNTLEQEILHELLHARSISYYDEDVFIKYMYEEESVLEMFNKQILLKEKIQYYDNAYSNMVECLEEISDIIGEDKYEFAKKLFNVKVSEREKWLRNLFKNNSNKEKLEDLLREAFVKW